MLKVSGHRPQPRAITAAAADLSPLSPGYNLHGYDPLRSFPRFRAALARAAAGGAPPRIMIVSNSIGAGVGATGTPTRRYGWPAYFTSALTALGFPAEDNNAIGGCLSSGDSAAGYLARMGVDVVGTFTDASEPSLGKGAQLATGDTTTTTSWTSPFAGSELWIFYTHLNGTNNMAYNIDSGTTTGTWETSVAGDYGASGRGMKIKVISGLANTTHSITTNRSASGGGVVSVTGFHVRDPSSGKIEVMVCGWPGARWSSGGSSGWSRPTNPENPRGTNGGFKNLMATGVDLAIFDLRLNDEGGDTFTAETPALLSEQVGRVLETIRTNSPTGCDSLMLSQHQSGLAGLSAATTQNLRNSLMVSSLATGAIFYDEFMEYGSYGSLSGLGYMADTLHPNESLNERKGKAVARIVAGMIA